MNIINLSYKNILRKKLRSTLTVFAIALSAWVLTSLLGFNKGYETALNKDIDNMGFQILVAAKGCPYEAATLMLKGGTGLRYMEENITEKITAYPETNKVTPMLMQAVFDPNKGESGGYTAYLGVDPETFPSMKSYLAFAQGDWFKKADANEVVLGYEAAELEQREVGDMLLIPEKNAELKVVGILKRSGTQDDGTIFMPVKTLQNIFDKKGKLTGVGIKVKKDSDINEFENKLYDLPDVQVVSMAQVKQTIMNLVTTAKIMVFSIVVIAVIIATVGVVNTILMSVFERFQEIGVLKSMGALPKDIFIMIWIETVFLCSAGGILGSGFAVILTKITDILIRRLLPYTPTGPIVIIDLNLILLTVFLIIAIGLVSGLYPAWKAANIRPIESMRREAN
ncbi:MAG: ABC transporter permease [Endomicrobiaceae bacterium]|jgi:putative ABC transport system permease protein|nr:ABC transporter permease [Endomicrobiaceae bacterium]